VEAVVVGLLHDPTDREIEGIAHVHVAIGIDPALQAQDSMGQAEAVVIRVTQPKRVPASVLLRIREVVGIPPA